MWRKRRKGCIVFKIWHLIALETEPNINHWETLTNVRQARVNINLQNHVYLVNVEVLCRCP